MTENTTSGVHTPPTPGPAPTVPSAPPKTDVAVAAPSLTQGKTPMDLVAEAVSKDVDVEKLDRLMALEERWRENQSRDAYVRAMTRFRSEAIEIVKTKKVGFDHKDGPGRTEYSYAPLSTILDAVVPKLSKHGLAHQWTTEQGDQIKVTCTIRHRDGHFEQTSLSAAPDPTGKKNAIQAVGSTVTYLERYTFLALTGLAAGDQDDDGRTGDSAVTLTEEEASTVKRLLEESAADKSKFLEWADADCVEKIARVRFSDAVRLLRQRIKHGPPGNE